MTRLQRRNRTRHLKWLKRHGLHSLLSMLNRAWRAAKFWFKEYSNADT